MVACATSLAAFRLASARDLSASAARTRESSWSRSTRSDGPASSAVRGANKLAEAVGGVTAVAARLKDASRLVPSAPAPVERHGQFRERQSRQRRSSSWRGFAEGSKQP